MSFTSHKSEQHLDTKIHRQITININVNVINIHVHLLCTHIPQAVYKTAKNINISIKTKPSTSTKVVQYPENAATLLSEIKVIKYIFIYNPYVKWSTVHVLKHTQ